MALVCRRTQQPHRHRSLLAACCCLVVALSPGRLLGLCAVKPAPATGRSAVAEPVQLITNRLCPFAQKAWIALEESALPYTSKEVSLYGSGGKPDWFMKLNPKGEIPVLVSADGDAVVDSELILDWVADAAPAMAPQDQELGNKWRATISRQLAPAGKRFVQMGGASAEEAMHASLAELDSILKASAGDFATGSSFSVADAAAVPFIQRIEQRYGLPESTPALRDWWAKVQARPGVQRTLQSSWWWWW
mmetsp:Transcript_31312/g.73013  ORF Transcript_31312/g.73013 Transcript_31312/m.73013 type:complete len:248 (+) Transcript_31312:96-839(+)